MSDELRMDGEDMMPIRDGNMDLKILVEEFRLKYPESSLGMTEDEIIAELHRAPAKSVQAFTKIAKDSKSTGRRPKGAK